MGDDAGTDDGPIDATFDREVDEACDRFERAWSRGDRPSLGECLDAASPPIRDLLFVELLSVELAWRRGAGEDPALEDYRERFPGQAREVDRAWFRARNPPTASLETRVGGGGPIQVNLPKIPNYSIGAELGRGGMGVVYRAHQLQLDRPCALKMIKAAGTTGGEATARFLAEARTVAKLNHPNIVQVHHFGLHHGQPYFEMEYVEGGSLARLLDGQAWPPDRAAGLVEAVATAVDAAHRLRIVHRDLKPANILLTADGAPKVADFGLAKSLEPGDEISMAGTLLGTPRYMAPEQARGATWAVGTATDVHALGAILYELLTGTPPFGGSSRFEILEDLKTRAATPPGRIEPGIPDDLEAVCLKCLEKSPAARYGSAGALAEDLRRFLNREPTMARPIEGKPKAPRRGRSLLITAGVGLALILAGLAALAGRRPPGGQAAPDLPGAPYVVRSGDDPFGIAQKILGDGNRLREIKTGTGRGLTDSDARRLVPGEVLYLPRKPGVEGGPGL